MAKVALQLLKLLTTEADRAKTTAPTSRARTLCGRIDIVRTRSLPKQCGRFPPCPRFRAQARIKLSLPVDSGGPRYILLFPFTHHTVRAHENARLCSNLVPKQMHRRTVREQQDMFKVSFLIMSSFGGCLPTACFPSLAPLQRIYAKSTVHKGPDQRTILESLIASGRITSPSETGLLGEPRREREERLLGGWANSRCHEFDARSPLLQPLPASTHLSFFANDHLLETADPFYMTT